MPIRTCLLSPARFPSSVSFTASLLPHSFLSILLSHPSSLAWFMDLSLPQWTLRAELRRNLNESDPGQRARDTSPEGRASFAF